MTTCRVIVVLNSNLTFNVVVVDTSTGNALPDYIRMGLQSDEMFQTAVDFHQEFKSPHDIETYTGSSVTGNIDSAIIRTFYK